MNWKIGQKLVCVGVYGDNVGAMIVPDKGEIVTFGGAAPYLDMPSCFIVEYPRGKRGEMQSFTNDCFRPLETRRDAKKDLLNQFIEVVESPDCPIQTPQTV